jgi:creatinine amidohydrolase
MSKVLIAEMTSPEFAEALKSSPGVIIPLGSTEVLGTHGPLGADFFVAAEASRAAAEKTGYLVAPVLPYGDTLELEGWPGTVGIPADTLRDLYLAAARSFLRSGVRRIVFLNCHSINHRAADAACRILKHEGASPAVVDWWKAVFDAAEGLIESASSPKGHGGEVITSVVMALRPDLVNIDAAANEVPKPGLCFHGAHTLGAGGPLYTYGNFKDYCDSGAWGDTSRATAEKGRLIFDRAVERIAALLREFTAGT